MHIDVTASIGSGGSSKSVGCTTCKTPEHTLDMKPNRGSSRVDCSCQWYSKLSWNQASRRTRDLAAVERLVVTVDFRHVLGIDQQLASDVSSTGRTGQCF